MKKRWYLILALMFLVLGGHYLFKEMKVKNVFDEMYYAETQSIPKQYTSTSYSNLIKSGDIKNLPRNMRNEFANFKRESYRTEALSQNEKLKLFFCVDDKTIEIIGTLKLSELAGESIRFTYEYDVENKQVKIENVEWVKVTNDPKKKDYRTDNIKEVLELIQHYNLTSADILDYQNYFLYEKVLSDWFEHNPNSRFSMDDLGDLEIIEVDMYEE